MFRISHSFRLASLATSLSKRTRTSPITCSLLEQQVHNNNNNNLHHYQVRTLALRSRRKRPDYEQYPEDKRGATPDAYMMSEPFSPEEKLEAYLEKASLSPWAPLPESAYRKYFDLSGIEPGDVHVDLGCGDGRVNFHSVDNMRVARTIGIDVDHNILNMAQERLNKRYPLPSNIEFLQADLMDENHAVWEKVRQGTIITMFFAEVALKKFRPILERKLAGIKCQILTAGYPMPSWHAHATEVVLGTKIHLYKWGYDEEDDDVVPLFMDESIGAEAMSPQSSIEFDERLKDYNFIDYSNLSPEEVQEREMDYNAREDTEWDEWEPGDKERKIVPEEEEEQPQKHYNGVPIEELDTDPLPGYWDFQKKQK